MSIFIPAWFFWLLGGFVVGYFCSYLHENVGSHAENKGVKK